MQDVVRVFVLIVCALVLGAYTSPGASAQEQSTRGKATVTGCLQKGDEPGEFSITGANGKTYGLRSKTVDLSQHLGHKVTVTGTLRPESTENEKGEARENEKSEKKEMTEAGDIRVSNLQMISEKCQ